MNYKWILICLILILLILGIFLIICLCRKREISEEFTNKDPMLIELHSMLVKLHPKASNINIERDNKSYTVNKKDMFLCLKDEHGEYYNKNMLLYVAIHELAHVLSKSVGHTDEFYKINDKLLDKATEMGIYNPSIPLIMNYNDRCGTGDK